MTNLIKADQFAPLFITESNRLSIVPGTIYAGHALPGNVNLPKKLKPGSDYAVDVEDGVVSAKEIHSAPDLKCLGGFHVGIDGKIVENSIWDAKFRPQEVDPRGMVFVEDFWADIYLLNTDPGKNGTSAAGVEIASGIEGILMQGERKPLTWWNAVAVMAVLGKQLLSMSEFCVAAQGVEEGKACGTKPKTTGHITGLKSRYGLEQATGCMWTWGRDFNPSGYAGIMGGYWGSGAAGPRRFNGHHPDTDYYYVGARGRCDHLILA